MCEVVIEAIQSNWTGGGFFGYTRDGAICIDCQWSFTTGRNTSTILCDSVMQFPNFCASVRFSGLNTMVPSCPLYQARTATPNHMPQFQKTDRSITQLTELPPPCRETHAFYPCQCRPETGHRTGFHMGIPKTC